jgi:hypothetical protein
MRDLSCTPKVPICSMDETKIPSIYASREDPESESRISRDSILLFFLSGRLGTTASIPVAARDDMRGRREATGSGKRE